MENVLVKIFGFIATVFHGDPAVFDRWMWLSRNLKPGNLRTLDAGCGSGAFSMYAAKKGNEVIGISFNERNNKIASQRAEILKLKNIKFIVGDLRKLDELADDIGRFDQIICFETIEHILNDQKLANDFSKLLNSGGRLLLTAPYKNYSKRLFRENESSLSTYEDGGHVRWGYDYDEMENILNKAGFVLEKKEYVSGLVSQLLISAHGILEKKINHRIVWLALFPFRIFVVFDKFISGLFKFPYLSIAVVGRKKI